VTHGVQTPAPQKKKKKKKRVSISPATVEIPQIVEVPNYIKCMANQWLWPFLHFLASQMILKYIFSLFWSVYQKDSFSDFWKITGQSRDPFLTLALPLSKSLTVSAPCLSFPTLNYCLPTSDVCVPLVVHKRILGGMQIWLAYWPVIFLYMLTKLTLKKKRNWYIF
jgi:hypothetical protein